MNTSAPALIHADARRSSAYDPWLFRYAAGWSLITLINLVAGGLVTSHSAGLAVPDWPTTYGENPFTFAYERWVGNIFYEHGHRLIASGVGLMTIGMLVLLYKREPRVWVRRLGWVALGAVILQGLLGGLTVKLLLPPAVSAAHAGLAQLFFCLAVSITLFLSRGWREAEPSMENAVNPGLRRWCIAAFAVIYLQVLLGAVMRHTDAGLAIPDFPLAYGRLVPPTDAATIEQINVARRLGLEDLPPVSVEQILIHYVHRLNAMLVAAILIAAGVQAARAFRGNRWVARTAWLLLTLLPIQIALGAWTVLSARQVTVNTAHVVVGASLLATSVVLTLRIYRVTGGSVTQGACTADRINDSVSIAAVEGAAA